MKKKLRKLTTLLKECLRIFKKFKTDQLNEKKFYMIRILLNQILHQFVFH